MNFKRPEYKDVDFSLDAIGKLPEDYNLVSYKYDGIYATLVTANSLGQIYSREGQLKREITFKSPVPSFTLTGEFMFGSNWAKRHGIENKFYAFDISVYRGHIVSGFPYGVRYGWIKTVAETLNESLSEDIFKQVVHFRRWPESKHVQPMFNACINSDIEGLVFRRLEGKLGDPLYRAKKRMTKDYVCLGFNPGRNKHEGSVGSLRVGQLDSSGDLHFMFSVGSGLTDDQRAELNAEPEEFLGKVLEVSYYREYADGTVRHPVFVRWRNDKTQTECLMQSETEKAFKARWGEKNKVHPI